MVKRSNIFWHDSTLCLFSQPFYSSSAIQRPPRRNHELTCANYKGGRHCRMFVFTLQIYTIIFSTKFEPFELDREQKMVWIMFYWLQCFVFIKSNRMDTYHSHAVLVFMIQGLWAVQSTWVHCYSHITYCSNPIAKQEYKTWTILQNHGIHSLTMFFKMSNRKVLKNVCMVQVRERLWLHQSNYG